MVVLRVQGSGCSVQGSGCRVQDSGFRVQGSGWRASRSLVAAQETVPMISIQEQPLSRNFERFRGGLVFEAHRLVYHSTPGSRVTKTKKIQCQCAPCWYQIINCWHCFVLLVADRCRHHSSFWFRAQDRHQHQLPRTGAQTPEPTTSKRESSLLTT